MSKSALEWMKGGDEANAEIRANIGKNRLTGSDIVPTVENERKMSPLAFAATWAGMSIILTGFMLPAQMYPAMSGFSIFLAFVLGCAICVVVLSLTGDIGISYGIPFAVAIRTVYGTVGTHIPSIVRAFPAMFWYGFQTWLGAYAINMVIDGWTGFSNLWLWIILFAAVQIYTTAKGIKAITWFERIATPIILVIFVYMLFLSKSNFGIGIISVLQTPGKGGMPFVLGMNAVIGYWATMALNIPDFTRSLKASRYKVSWWWRNVGSIWSQASGLIITMTFVALVGLVCAIATGEWHPVDQIMVIVGGYGPQVVLVLIMIALAQWTTNIGANILPPAFIFANVGAPKISFKIGCIIAGVIGLLLQPWNLASQLVTVFAVISALLGSVAGTMICDYYILRRRKIDLKALYDPNGHYKYAKGFNPAGFIAFAVGCVLGMLWLDLSYFVSIISSLVVYFILMKVWIIKKYPQPEIL